MAIIEVLKYNGGPDVFAWKYPSEELGTWTQLIVNESQEAVLVKEGQILDIFGSGRHTLETANIPLLNKIVNLPFGGRSPFTAEVWYINKAFNLDIKWGTPTPIQIQDPKYGIFVPVRSNGIFGIHIVDSAAFLVKLVGTLRSFDQTSITKYFRGLYITKVKDAISSYLIHKQISILEINAYIDELSQYMEQQLQPALAEYGIALASFYVNDIGVPEDDSAVKQLKNALSKRAEMNIIGYSYQQERSFDTLDSATQNTSSTTTPLMGLGIGMGMGRVVSSQFAPLGQELHIEHSQSSTKDCPNCHAAMSSTQRFCGNCGHDTDSTQQHSPKDSVICAACGATLAQRTNFCPECGQPLTRKCPSCNSSLEGTPKFCPECGQKL